MTSKLKDVVILTNFFIDETFITSREGSIDKDTLCDHLLGQVPQPIHIEAIASN